MGHQPAAAPLPFRTDGGDALERIVGIAGDHDIFHPADDLAVFDLVSEVDVHRELAADGVALTQAQDFLDNHALPDTLHHLR